MNWPQLVYAYGLGGAFFFLTLWLCFRPGGNDKKNPADRRTRISLLAGLAGYFVVILVWILLATP